MMQIMMGALGAGLGAGLATKTSSHGPDVDLDLLFGGGAAGATPPLTIADHRLDLRVQLRAE